MVAESEQSTYWYCRGNDSSHCTLLWSKTETDVAIVVDTQWWPKRMTQLSGSVWLILVIMMPTFGRPELPQACSSCSCIKTAAILAAAVIDRIKSNEEQLLKLFFSIRSHMTRMLSRDYCIFNQVPN